MSVEQLLKPRYKVIADYPENPFVVGAVLNEYTEENEGKKYLMYAVGDHDFIVFGHDEYPHLFKPLQWWEEREESEMPEYVRWSESLSGICSQVIEWRNGHLGWECRVIGARGAWNCMECSLVPATLAEYTDYLTQINKK